MVCFCDVLDCKTRTSTNGKMDLDNNIPQQQFLTLNKHFCLLLPLLFSFQESW